MSAHATERSARPWPGRSAFAGIAGFAAIGGLAGIAGIVLLSSALAAETAGQPPSEFRFEKLNRSYSDFVTELAPIGGEGLSIQLTSPHQTLVLRGHRIRLAPLPQGGAGSFAGEIELDVQGKGTLIADVTMGPIERQLSDEIVVPPQTLHLVGKVRIRRLADGYEVTPVELPKSLEVAVQSKTINQILALCDQAATLSLGAVDCSGLQSSLTRPAVPIPGGGQAFRLGDEELSDTDRGRLDALLGPAPGPPPVAP